MRKKKKINRMEDLDELKYHLTRHLSFIKENLVKNLCSYCREEIKGRHGKTEFCNFCGTENRIINSKFVILLQDLDNVKESICRELDKNQEIVIYKKRYKLF